MLPGVEELGRDLAIHGDFIKDVAYSVDNIDAVMKVCCGVSSLFLIIFFQRITEANGNIIRPIETVSDKHGSVKIATVASLQGSLIHSLVQNIDYDGVFLPGFTSIENFTLAQTLGRIPLLSLDHVVENYDEDVTPSVADWYGKTLNLTRFW